jgi:two-component system, LytTR family, sensor kinase
VLAVFVVYEQVLLREAARRELLATQLRALRAQLQPHFLFNTLHTIGVTAKQDGATAARMTTLLGDLLRQTLRERGGALVSLAEEHDLLQPYLQLQQLRFGDRLRVDVDLPADVLAGAVPDLVLQPLVENALQHGIEQRPGDGHVRVVGRHVGDHLLIDVHDDGVGLPALASEPVLGTGLGATKARLQAIYGDGASLSLRGNERGGTTASLRLPWREVAHAA